MPGRGMLPELLLRPETRNTPPMLRHSAAKQRWLIRSPNNARESSKEKMGAV